jgi:arylsulfatase A-like enzyme
VAAEIDFDNTLLFFSSDNGGPRNQGADNGDLRDGKATTYEGGIRVAAFAYAPKLLKPGVSEQVMTVWDVLPTLAGAAKVEIRTKLPLDGMNLWPVLRGEEPPVERRSLFFCTQPETGIRQYALRDGDWKLVRTMTEPVREELYQVVADPFEKENRLPSEYAMGFAMRKMMDDWIALHPRGDVMYTSTPHPGWVTPKDWAKVPVE